MDWSQDACLQHAFVNNKAKLLLYYWPSHLLLSHKNLPFRLTVAIHHHPSKQSLQQNLGHYQQHHSQSYIHHLWEIVCQGISAECNIDYKNPALGFVSDKQGIKLWVNTSPFAHGLSCNSSLFWIRWSGRQFPQPWALCFYHFLVMVPTAQGSAWAWLPSALSWLVWGLSPVISSHAWTELI